MTVLVSGGAGFIGSHVVDALRADGREVIVIDSLDPGVHHGAPSYLRSDVDYCFTDLRTWRPDSRFSKVELIVHLAALGGVSRAGREPGEILTANCGGTARLVEATYAMPRLSRVVLGSSFSVYGSNYMYRCATTGKLQNAERRREDLEAGRYEVYSHETGEPAEIVPVTVDAVPAPLETYAASKYMQELCFRGFTRCPVQILRFSSVYGPRLRLDDGEATIVARLAGWIRAGVSPKLLEDGRQIRDWVYVGDVVAAILASIRGVSALPVVNVCSGVPTTLVEACRELSSALKRAIQPEIVGGYRPGDMRHCLGDAGPFTNFIGRVPLTFHEGAPLAFGGQPSPTHSSVPLSAAVA